MNLPPCPLGFTGIDSAYEPPEKADLIIKAGEWTLDECVEKVVQLLQSKVPGSVDNLAACG